MVIIECFNISNSWKRGLRIFSTGCSAGYSPSPGFYNCVEWEQPGYPSTSFGLNYAKGGFITGQFNYTGAPVHPNGTLVTQTFYDSCVNNNTLIEFVCGKSIDASLAPYAGAVLVTCGEPGVNGTKCVPDPSYNFAAKCA
jgi:hypothetical protein